MKKLRFKSFMTFLKDPQERIVYSSGKVTHTICVKFKDAF